MKRILLLVLPLLLAGSGITCLGGCTTLAQNNQELTFSFANSFSIKSTVTKVPDTVAERTLKIDKSVLEYVIGGEDDDATDGD